MLALRNRGWVCCCHGNRMQVGIPQFERERPLWPEEGPEECQELRLGCSRAVATNWRPADRGACLEALGRGPLFFETTSFPWRPSGGGGGGGSVRDPPPVHACFLQEQTSGSGGWCLPLPFDVGICCLLGVNTAHLGSSSLLTFVSKCIENNTPHSSAWFQDDWADLRVRVGTTPSRMHTQKKGMPQGVALSCMLFIAKTCGVCS